MENLFDRRTFERRGCNVSIEFSVFNQAHRYDAEMLNIGAGGMCFQSHRFMQPGTTVCIRLKDFKACDSAEDGETGLRSMSLAQVKWCHERPGAYDVGVKYQAPQY